MFLKQLCEAPRIKIYLNIICFMMKFLIFFWHSPAQKYQAKINPTMIK